MKNLHIIVPFLVVALYCVATYTEAAFNLEGGLRPQATQLSSSSFTEINNPEGKSGNRLESSSQKPRMDRKLSDSNPLKGVTCDFSLSLPGVTTTQSTLRTAYEMQSKKVLCVELENRTGTGYLWALVGVYNENPTVTTDMFPVELSQLKNLVNNSIVVTQPKAEKEKKKSPAPNSPQSNEDTEVREYRPAALGGTTTVSSKIRPLKTGVFYVVYAFYRPFNVSEAPNVRILELRVNWAKRMCKRYVTLNI